MKFLILILTLFLISCSNLPTNLIPIQQPQVWQLDLGGTIDSVRWEGVAVGSSAKAHTIDVVSKTDVNFFRVISCHRYEQFEDVIQTNWFQPKRGYEYIYEQAPGVEDTGWCILRLQAFSKQIDSNGNPILQDPPEPTLQETQDAISARIQNTIDTLAKSWGYDNIVSAISYLSSSNKQYAADATALNTWRDAVWTWAFQNFPSITAGQDVNAFLANIPAAPSKPTVSG